MAENKKLTWRDGSNKDELILSASDGNDIAHIFPRDGYPGSFALITRDHGGNWGDKPARYGTKLECQGHAVTHGHTYYQQEARNLSEASRSHLINDLQREWERMGGDQNTIKKFRTEWDRVSAAEHHLKVIDRDEGHER